MFAIGIHGWRLDRNLNKCFELVASVKWLDCVNSACARTCHFEIGLSDFKWYYIFTFVKKLVAS